MTCIVGYVDKIHKKVFIGGDSAASNGYSVSIRKDTKVFNNNGFVIGCTSSFRMIQLLRFSLMPPDIGNKDIYEYMCTDFINSIRTCFKKGGYMQKTDLGDEKGGVFLVGYKDRLFNIGDDFQVAENLNGFDSVGCGSDFALGSLHTLSTKKISTETKIIKALEAAEFFGLGINRPFIILNTE